MKNSPIDTKWVMKGGDVDTDKIKLNLEILDNGLLTLWDELNNLE